MPVNPTQREMEELRSTIQDLTRAVTALNEQLAVHNAEQKPMEKLVAEHEKILRGEGNAPGLVAQNVALQKSMGNIERAVWVIVGVILTYFVSAWLGVTI